jgi:cytochrome c biogenesis factor
MYVSSKEYLLFFIFVIITTYNVKFIFFLNFFFFGLFKIHPPLFYISLLSYSYSIAKNYLSYRIRLVWLVYLSITSLLLGGIWALYQLNWGYYWSNDPIEFALLLIVTIYVYHLHKLNQLHYYRYINFVLVVLYIYLIRSNLIYTKHNFFNLFNYLTIYVKVISYFLIINTFNYINLKLNWIKYSRFIIYLYIIIVPLTFNLTFNIHTKKMLLTYSKIFILYSGFLFFWEESELSTTHSFIFLSLILFNMYKIQYFISFLYKQPAVLQEYYFYKKNIKIESNYYTISKKFNTNYVYKSNNFFKKKKINIFLIKKYLVNYFI